MEEDLINKTIPIKEEESKEQPKESNDNNKPVIDFSSFLNKKKERENNPKTEDIALQDQMPIKKQAFEIIPKAIEKISEEPKTSQEIIEEPKKVQEIVNEPHKTPDTIEEPHQKQNPIIEEPKPILSNDKPIEETNKTPDPSQSQPVQQPPIQNQIIDNLLNSNKTNDSLQSPSINTPITPIINQNPLAITQQQASNESQQNNQSVNNLQVNPSIALPELPVQTKKVISFAEAKKEIDDMAIQLDNMQKELQEKYSIHLPDSSYEDNLPDETMIKLIEDFFDSSEIKELITKATAVQTK